MDDVRSDATDEALLAEYAAGNAGAFTRLYERHERPVFRFLLRSLGNQAAADEVMQEVWFAVVRNARNYEPRAKFTTWLYGIARTKLIDHWRARDPAMSYDAEAANDPDENWVEALPAAASVQPEVQALSRAQARAFVTAVEQLPAAQREAFLLHVEADLTLEEIAQTTGAGTETVKSRLRYAMNKLRAAMEEWR
jgi:RNA polymerase sigma-70 factor (ECF subfamily)